MRIIKKKISLEPFKSRNNFKISSYSNGSLFKFSNDSNSCDYGMIPIDVERNGMIISYATMMRIYYFMKKYEEMLTVIPNCNSTYKTFKDIIQYSNSISYYNNEIFDKNIFNKNFYEKLKDEYEYYSNCLGEDFVNWVDEKRNTVDYDSECDFDDLNEKNSACINITILMTNNIDDMGELTTFSNEWEDGSVYNENDIILYNNEPFKKNSNNGIGSIFSNKYKESYFANKSYLEKINSDDLEWLNKSGNDIEGNIQQWDYNTHDMGFNEFETEKSYKNGVIIYNPKYISFSDDGNIDFNSSMSDIIKIETNKNDGIYFYKDKIFKASNERYIEYNGVKYIVYDSKINNMRLSYTFINNIKYYSTFINGKEYFLINEKKYTISSKTFININGIFIETDGLFKIDGYFTYDNIIYYVYNNKISEPRLKDDGTYEFINLEESIFGKYINFDEIKENQNNLYGYSIHNNLLFILKPFIKYSNIINGNTESKLTNLYTKPFAFDNLGNILPCSFNKNSEGNIVQPDNENNYLGFICNVGNTSDLENYGDNKFWGNIITNMTLYYKDNNNNVISKNEDFTGDYNEIISFINSNENNNNIIKTLYCDITYYIGAIIALNNDSYEYVSNGVKYVDTVYLTKEITEFYKSKTHMILVNYFKLNYNKSFIKYNEYNNKTEEINKSRFILNYDKRNFEDSNRGLCELPTFREEYKLGSSSLEKIDSNIYIDRGISNAFEKHLKLLEINSLESLEQYGNGFYNIIKN